MNINLQLELRRMGIGWFILKYAEDHGISIPTSTNYGKQNSMNTRLGAYERTKNEHGKMIKQLKTAHLKKSVKAGDPILDAIQIEDVLSKI